jgi:hypothetical protein
MFTTFQTFDFEITCCRLWNNLQQVIPKSKVWKVVNMTRFLNKQQQVRSKSKVWKVVLSKLLFDFERTCCRLF